MSGPFGSSQWIYSSGAAAVEGQSLRFNDNDSAYLNRTPSSAGNRKTWTWSGWVKRGNLGIDARVLQVNGTSADFSIMFQSDDTIRAQMYTSGSQDFRLITNAKYRDVSAWYNIVFTFDTSNSTSSERARLYVNGERVASFSTGNYPSLNFNGLVSNTDPHYLAYYNGSIQFFDGYMAEVNFVDGTAYDPTYFGQTDDNGQWVPIIAPSVTYGTNGFYLPFLNGIGDDESGNSNDWTANNLATTDLMLDHAQNNFATMNPLASSSTLSEGNLRSQYSGSGTYQSAASTMSISSGKWYVELRVTVANTFYPGFGIADITTEVASNPNHTSYLGLTSNGIAYYTNNGFFTNNAIDQSSTVTVSSGDIIGIAIDLDSAQNTYKIYQNGTLAETYNINAPANAYAFCESTLGTASAARADWNFGQDSSFHGLETAQGNQDENGFGDFYYAPPTGYLALCSQNLPDPAITDGSDYFNTSLWTGNDTQRSITGVGFQPDLVWTKYRSATGSHTLMDSVRGASARLFSNLTNAEDATNGLISFDADGFTMGNNATSHNMNDTGKTVVGWSWLAGNSTSSNTNGSITSTVSANTTAGFSIVSYTGNGSNGTVGHGLSETPDMIIVKNRSSSADWPVYFSGITSSTEVLRLNSTVAKLTGRSEWNSTAPTSSVFSVGNDSAVNTNTDNYIAYCFHSVEGYSKFGSYTGNGSTDGPFVYTGFRPAFVIYKRSDSTGGFLIFDASRNTYNEVDKELFTHSANGEGTNSDVDFLSNGFKLRTTSGNNNTSGGTYIYMAFAESPFKYSSAR